VPEGGSQVLRQIIEALFITHAETKLNAASCLVDKSKSNVDDVQQQQQRPWCYGLVRRPLSSFVTAVVKPDLQLI
jgi:hypothetical protein